MEDVSIFLDKTIVPTMDDLAIPLKDTLPLWQKIEGLVLTQYPKGIQEWNFPGKKYGWSYRIKDKKRAILYFLPREGYFKVAFVFGQKATDAIMESNIADSIKTELINTKKFAEGRGIRISVKDESILSDIEELIQIKLNQ